MKRSSWLIVGIVALVAVCALSVRFLASDSQQHVSPSPTRVEETPATINREPSTVGTAELQEGRDSESGQRVSISAPAVVVTVTDEGQNPVPDATCCWTHLPEPDFTGLYVWGLMNWDEVNELNTDASGRCSFSSDPKLDPSDESLLWVSAPGFRAAWMIVP